MESKKVTKLPKPSAIKPPQIRTQRLPGSSENIASSSSNSVTTLPKIALRRSKSYTDLKHAGMSKITEGKLHRPPPTKLEPLRENIRTVSTSKNAAAVSYNVMPKLRRRSNSVTDLRAIETKPKITKPQKTGTINKVILKRKGEKLPDQIKPKVVKQAKIPDWDYKSRYNQLHLKYIDLNEEHKKQRSKMEEFNVIEEKYNDLMKQCEKLQEQLDKSNAENARLFKENKILDKENKTLNSNFLNLETSHLLLKEKHNELCNRHDNLKIDFGRISDENKKFDEKLQSALKTIADLTEQNVSLKNDVNNGGILRRNLHNLVQDLKGNIRVFCRVRPPSTSEEDCLLCNINFIDEKVIEIKKSRESINAISGRPNDFKAEFTVDQVFQPESTQEEIFEEVSQLVQSAIDGYDVCVFAYGQTGSGKTYTMQGEDSPEKRGLIPRTVDLIFSQIKNLEMAGWNYEISASFLEIYNENIRDLLNPDSEQNLEIRYNEGKGITVTNLTIQKLDSAEELKHLMGIAERYRAVAATDFNEHSSRSHAITKIYLQGTHKDLNIMYTGSVNLVDLAGSESAKTSSTERLTETKHINKSLSALEGVMLALYSKAKYIPYRNSKLTYLLQSCLGGSSKTLMVVNIAPFEECYMESIYSLRFAAKVKEVKTSARRNKTVALPLAVRKP